MKTTLVFDVDETLVVSNWTYDKAYTDFFNYLHLILPGRVPSLHDIYDRLFAIEAELAPKWGVKRGRVAESMVRVYCEICDWSEGMHGENSYRSECEVKIREIGDQPFNYSHHYWLPGVKDTLFSLMTKGHILCLLTSYDTNLFSERAKYLGFKEFFGERMLAIETKKTNADFISASGWNSSMDGRWYAVGNSPSDIMPALEISENWHGIHIPRRSTSPFLVKDKRKTLFDSEPIDHPRVVNIRRFTEILDHI